MKLLHFLILLLLLSILSSAFDFDVVWSPIGNLKDPHVIDMAKYDVTRWNKQNGTNLQFLNVLDGLSQAINTDNTTY